MELEMDSLTKGYFCRKFATANASTAPKYEHLPVFKAGLSSSYDGCATCKEKGAT